VATLVEIINGEMPPQSVSVVAVCLGLLVRRHTIRGFCRISSLSRRPVVGPDTIHRRAAAMQSIE